MQVSYSFSRYEATAQDSDFINSPEDTNRPTHFIGPNALDRTHQLSFGGTLDLPKSLRVSVISHFYSPLPLNLRLPTTGLAGGIFVTDVTGDGTGDGTSVSNGNGLETCCPEPSWALSVAAYNPQSLAKLITAYNQQLAEKPTPAGQALLMQEFLPRPSSPIWVAVHATTRRSGSGPGRARVAEIA